MDHDIATHRSTYRYTGHSKEKKAAMEPKPAKKWLHRLESLVNGIMVIGSGAGVKATLVNVEHQGPLSIPSSDYLV